MIWGSSRKACWKRGYLPWVLKEEEYFPDVYDGLGWLCKGTEVSAQGAQHTGFLELKECPGVGDGDTLGVVAGNMDQGLANKYNFDGIKSGFLIVILRQL